MRDSLSMKEHAVPGQQIWLTVCFWRPSNLSSALSSLSMLPLNKSNYIPLRIYVTTRMLVRKPSKSPLKGRLVDTILIGTQNLKIFPFFSENLRDTKNERNYHQRILSCRWARTSTRLRPYMRVKPHDLPTRHSEADCSTMILSPKWWLQPIKSCLLPGSGGARL